MDGKNELGEMQKSTEESKTDSKITNTKASQIKTNDEGEKTDQPEHTTDNTEQKNESEIQKDLNTIENPGGADGAKRKSTPELSSKEKMVKELEKMKRADDLREEWRVYEFKKMCRKHKDELEREKAAKGIQLNPGVNESKKAIKAIMDEEEFFALKKQRRKFREESAMIRRSLEEKMGILVRRENPDLKKMVETFIYKPENNSSIPEHILKVLSWAEIEDLKKCYDLFDVKGKGYINARDVKRIAKMLGFRATKDVFDGMISELAGPHKDRVTFINFLDFIIKSQGEGPDPYDEIKQAFKLMDTNDNGFVTLSDLKTACEGVNLNFSNKILQEMMEEADNTGNGKISLEEFTNIMCQTGRFKRSVPQ